MSIKATTESMILRACLDYLGLVGVLAWRSNNMPVPLKGGGFRRFVGMRGCADILGVLDGGRILCVEVKKPGGRLSRDQKYFLDLVRGKGGLSFCVHDVGELEAALRSEGVIE